MISNFVIVFISNQVWARKIYMCCLEYHYHHHHHHQLPLVFFPTKQEDEAKQKNGMKISSSDWNALLIEANVIKITSLTH